MGMAKNKICETKLSKSILKINKNLSIKYPKCKEILKKFKLKLIQELYVPKYDKNLIVIYLSDEYIQKFRKIQAIFTQNLENLLKDTFIIIVSFKVVIPYKFQKITNRKSYAKSFTKVNEIFLKDSLFPSVILGKRIFYYLFKKISKIYVESKAGYMTQLKLNCLSCLYLLIFNKNIEFELI